MMLKGAILQRQNTANRLRNFILLVAALSICNSCGVADGKKIRRRRMSETQVLNDLRIGSGSISSNTKRNNIKASPTKQKEELPIKQLQLQQVEGRPIDVGTSIDQNWCSQNVSMFNPWSFTDVDGLAKPLFHVEIELTGVSRHREMKLVRETQFTLRKAFSNHIQHIFNSNSDGNTIIRYIDFEAGLGLPAYSFQIWDKSLTLFFKPPVFRGTIYHECSSTTDEDQPVVAVDEVIEILRSSVPVLERHLQEDLSFNEDLQISWNIANVSLREHVLLEETSINR